MEETTNTKTKERNEELMEEFRVTVYRDTPIGKYYAEFATYD